MSPAIRKRFLLYLSLHTPAKGVTRIYGAIAAKKVSDVHIAELVSSRTYKGIRNANVGIASVVALLILGLIFLPDSETAAGAFGIGAFIAGFAIYFLLDWRDGRARDETTPRSH